MTDYLKMKIIYVQNLGYRDRLDMAKLSEHYARATETHLKKKTKRICPVQMKDAIIGTIYRRIEKSMEVVNMSFRLDIWADGASQ